VTSRSADAPPFRSVLIANRGEIALRVIRACRELGIRSIAIYSEADADALHVQLADEAHPCGPAAARESYLDMERIVAIARRAGVDAIHPGYGFLSENGDFADLCQQAGIRFIGPEGRVIRAMGDKLTSRRLMVQSGVPVVPGSADALPDEAVLGEAAELGYPLMLKASGGGGGRGLRLVRDAAALAKALPRARSEARSAFGSDAVYLEQAIVGARHVEVQILADAHGGTLQLFERECSIQRRHQKLIEEAPASRIDPRLRARLGETAIAAARAVGYEGAGTVEFLLDPDGRFYFLEMNTRIQVEHAVTEAVTGVDLVASMIRIAAGEPLPFGQADLALGGHAIEARIYAEDPERRFLPSPGVVTRFRPPGGDGVRVDAGLAEGDEVTIHYDPLIAKLIVHAADRPAAVARITRAADDFEVVGIRTTLAFHRKALRHPDFVHGRYDTRFVGELIGEPVGERMGAG
jgi:acetyl-CoA carboxylase biotin carboxylase subunit